MANIVFVGALPPPVNGLTNANSATIDALSLAGHVVTALNVSSGSRGGTFFRHWSRLRAVVSALTKVIRSRSYVLAYLPIDGGLGLGYGIVFALIFRLLSYPVVAHHHSYSYINRSAFLMRVFLYLSSPRQLHVFLCEDMMLSFEVRYRSWLPREYRGAVLPNAFMMAPSDISNICRSIKNPERLIIGHLSNLCPEKGTNLFLDLFEHLVASGIPIDAYLAGPTSDSRIASRIEMLATRHASEFHYLGPLYDVAKRNFFAIVDVFVFPTQYKNEAQPLVLIEASNGGCLIATIARGCIECDYKNTNALVVDQNDDFVKVTTSWLVRLSEAPDKFSELRAASQRNAGLQQTLASHALAGWLNSITVLMGEP